MIGLHDKHIRRRAAAPAGGSVAFPTGRLSTFRRNAPLAPSELAADTAAPPALRELGWPALVLVFLGSCYNALLAIVNAHAVSVSTPMVVASEMLILAAAMFFIVSARPRPGDTAPIAFLAFFVLNAVALSLINGGFYVDMARNVAIMAVFMLLGVRTSRKTLDRVFLLVAVLVFAALALEIISTPAYAAFFKPALYYANTRGIEQFELDEIGLFRNTLSFEGRFALANLVDHRTASLFLEQVSLANFSTVICMFLLIEWHRLNKRWRGFLILLVGLILITNNTRTGLFLALATPVVYFLAPKLSRPVNLLFIPVGFVAAAIMAHIAPDEQGDNLVGRLSLTYRTLTSMDMSGLLGGEVFDANGFHDSGYTYVIYACSIFGMLVLWLFLAFATAAERPEQKRLLLITNLYFALNLLTGSSAIFSMKVASLLWLLVGVVARGAEPVVAEPAAGDEQADADAAPPPARYNVLGANVSRYRAAAPFK
ncbi:hypothetical protein HMF7854_15120 [Sphingomonas ginkgonis]|uniref:Polymerase n=1 Tax=Sphingomonas ginkgonis TaxID=2315330 RepID=A0A3R9YNW6_9SPHN|nr:hypothetical protein [Sphingomonas ginkgonis]RST32023.1 hypothetical protein HMF7854_15120 [Sphingomonas ginkgonis]